MLCEVDSLREIEYQRLSVIVSEVLTGLLSLPFEVHLLIVRPLCLKDCIAYMQVCTVSHDVVYYEFAHRNFESVLDESGTIALMKVLYAHTRAMNFCLNPNFTMLDEFCRYFTMYWSYRVIDTEQFDGYPEAVGHPSGHLERMRYLGDGGGSTREQSVELCSLWRWNQDWNIMGRYVGMMIKQNLI